MSTDQFIHTFKLFLRYVREWLGGMAAAQIITIDEINSTNSINEGHYNIIKEYAGLAQGMKTCIGRFDITKQFFKTSGPWGEFV